MPRQVCAQRLRASPPNSQDDLDRPTRVGSRPSEPVRAHLRRSWGSPGANRAKPRSSAGLSPPAPSATCLSRGWTDSLADRRARHRRRPSPPPGRFRPQACALRRQALVGTLPLGASPPVRRRGAGMRSVRTLAPLRGRSGMPPPPQTSGSFSHDRRLGRRVASTTHPDLN